MRRPLACMVDGRACEQPAVVGEPGGGGGSQRGGSIQPECITPAGSGSTRSTTTRCTLVDLPTSDYPKKASMQRGSFSCGCTYDDYRRQQCTGPRRSCGSVGSGSWGLRARTTCAPCPEGTPPPAAAARPPRCATSGWRCRRGEHANGVHASECGRGGSEVWAGWEWQATRWGSEQRVGGGRGGATATARRPPCGAAAHPPGNALPAVLPAPRYLSTCRLEASWKVVSTMSYLQARERGGTRVRGPSATAGDEVAAAGERDSSRGLAGLSSGGSPPHHPTVRSLRNLPAVIDTRVPCCRVGPLEDGEVLVGGLPGLVLPAANTADAQKRGGGWRTDGIRGGGSSRGSNPGALQAGGVTVMCCLARTPRRVHTISRSPCPPPTLPSLPSTLPPLPFRQQCPAVQHANTAPSPPSMPPHPPASSALPPSAHHWSTRVGGQTIRVPPCGMLLTVAAARGAGGGPEAGSEGQEAAGARGTAAAARCSGASLPNVRPGPARTTHHPSSTPPMHAHRWSLTHTGGPACARSGRPGSCATPGAAG